MDRLMGGQASRQGARAHILFNDTGCLAQNYWSDDPTLTQASIDSTPTIITQSDVGLGSS